VGSRQAARVPTPASAGASAPGPDAPESAERGASWVEFLSSTWSALGTRVWEEVRGLIRVTPIDQPEAMLIAPEQAFFLRENLKLRLLNARLALLSRQFDTAQSDLRDAQSALERYFDPSSRRVLNAIELVRLVGAQARQVVAPRPDATLAAIAAVAGGR
jgi:uroporphyrin-3 C-methyltransferase